MASDLSQGAGSYQGNVSGGAAFALDNLWNVTVLECNKARDPPRPVAWCMIPVGDGAEVFGALLVCV